MENTFNICDPDEWILGRFCEYKVYNKKQLKKVHSWIKDQEWKDGLKTLRWKSSHDAHWVKKNQELKNPVPDDLIWPYVNASKKFMNFTSPSTSGSPICSRTSKGGYYKPHFDDIKNGQFSTTIFLSDPDEYEGGELVLWIDGKEVFFKPKAGRAVTYETGIGHRVNTVTKGERLAFVFWTFSNWNNLNTFHDWKYYNLLCKYTYNDDSIDTFMSNTLEEYLNIPYNRMRRKEERAQRSENPKGVLQ
jgi:PKHD-type hydroxylase